MPGAYTPPESGDAPEEVKKILREVYQECREANPGEEHEKKEKCARIAWAAVKKAGYHKDEDGEWVKKSEKQHTAGQAGDIIAITGMGSVGATSARTNAVHSFENTTLQKLEDWIPDQKTGSYNPAKPFADNVETWEGCPVVYGEGGIHPDPALFEEDQEAALEAVRKKTGKRCDIVGSISDPRVEVEGQPRLMATMSFDDQEAYQLWEDGKLRVSTALFVREKNKEVVEVVRASHVLIFPSNSADQADKGALIMNTDCHKGDDMNQGENKGAAAGKSIVRTAIDKLKRAVDELGQALRTDQADEVAHADAKDIVPQNPSDYGVAAEDAEWVKPALGDLSDTEKRTIASCYAYIGDLEDFGSYKLPHHDPKSKNVVWQGVASAMAALSGARGGVDLGTKAEEVRSHLVGHYKDFDKEAPAGETENERVGRDEMTNTELDELKKKVNSLEVEAKTNIDALKTKESEIAALKDKEQAAVQQMNTMKTDLDKAEAELKKYKAAEEETKFQGFLNTLPKGLTHKEEDKQALRDKWNTDAKALFLEVAPKMNTGKMTGEAGSEHDVKNTADMSQEEYMASRKTIGSIIDEQRKAGGK